MERRRQVRGSSRSALRWIVLTISVVVSAAASEPAFLVPTRGAMVISVGDADPFTDREDGLVRITGRTVSVATGAVARSISFANLALITGTGDTVASRPDSLPRAPGGRLLPIQRVDRNGDGIVDDDDEVRFWARGTSIWKRDPILGGWIRSFHPYDTARKFYLQTGSSTPSPDLGPPRRGAWGRTHASVPALRWVGRPHSLMEKGLVAADPIDPQTGMGWYWMRSEMPVDVALDAEGLSAFPRLASDSAWITVQQASTSYPQVPPNPSSLAIRVNGKGGALAGSSARAARFRYSGLREASNAVVVAGLSQFHLAGVSMEWRQDPSTLDSVLFPAPAVGRIAVPSPRAGACWVLEGGVAVRTCAIEDGLLRDSVGDPDTWYAVFPPEASSRPVSIAPWREPSVANAVSLTESGKTFDVVVVTPDEFLPVAQEYAAWRAMDWQVRRMNVGILRAGDVWAGWSGGSMDPAALRDALRWAKVRWGSTHALLLGAGTADPRGLWPKSPVTRLPQWEDQAIATDDFFTWFSRTDQVPGIALGRVPAYDLGQARAWLEKVKRFEDPSRASFGPWRNTMVLLADDQRQGSSLDLIRHSEQIQSISREIEVQRPWVRLVNIYENAYPPTAQGFKPDVRRDLVAALNGEASAFVYMGHGSPGILADEVVMDVPSFQREIHNADRPWFAILGSCSVGRNDQVGSTGLLENFVVASEKGAYAGIAATRITTPLLNRDLFIRFWRSLLDATRPTTLGEALQNAKRASEAIYNQNYTNQSLYNILGDPALVPYPGGIKVGLDSLPRIFQPLSHVTLSGTGSQDADLQLRMEHSLPMLRFADSSQSQDRANTRTLSKVVQEIRPSPAQFSGLVLPGGARKYSLPFLLPARLPIGDTAWAKVYAWNPRTRMEGGAVSPPSRIDGMGSLVPDDLTGPKIWLRHCDSSWGGGINFGSVAKLSLPICLDAFLEDSSGVSSSLGPDEGVVFSLPGIRDAWHPPLVIGNSLKTVSTRLELDSSVLAPGGRYPFRVSASDLMGNISTADLILEPLKRGDYAVYDLYAHPNPVRDDEGVRFGFKVASEPDSTGGIDTRVEASIRIHTVTGKLVRMIRTELTTSTRPRPRADWDLRDAFGKPVANGMYPYTATLRIPEPFGTRVKELRTRGVLVVAR